MENKKLGEYDISDEVWDVYKKVYLGNWDFYKKIRHSGKRRYCLYVKTELEHILSEEKYKTFLVSGETDFNFHENRNGQAQYNIYLKYLERDYKGKQLCRYKQILKRCKLNHHSIQNCSLMPCSGNLQGIKKGGGNDRLDTFIYLLSLYYQRQKVEIVLTKATFENCEALKQYLDQFKDIYDYCKRVYFISKSLTEKLINNGKKALNSGAAVVTYMALANQFWQEKAKHYQTKEIDIEVIDIFK